FIICRLDMLIHFLPLHKKPEYLLSFTSLSSHPKTPLWLSKGLEAVQNSTPYRDEDFSTKPFTKATTHSQILRIYAPLSKMMTRWEKKIKRYGLPSPPHYSIPNSSFEEGNRYVSAWEWQTSGKSWNSENKHYLKISHTKPDERNSLGSYSQRY